MEYTTLGDTGMKVSRICLGCMSFGSTDFREWVLEEEESREIIERAIDLGINFFDTANVYSWGESERILGKVLGDYNRDSQVVATKAHFEMDQDNPNSSGLSRKALEQELENSLDRLDMDTIDLYQTHRWDYATPIEETLRALDDAVRRNQVRYIGTSSQWAYQFADSLHTSERLGLERFQTMQNHYNLAYREEEREMIPLMEQENVGAIPWSPLARGYLTRPHDKFLTTKRAQYMENSQFGERIKTYRANGGDKINERVEDLADDKGVSMAQIALAWLFHQNVVDAPIIGTTKVTHLEDAVEALEIDLSSSDLEYLKEPYGPVEPHGHE
jgi:aryl-alcohol dehydrogenase-like predicted oxidoreductase